LEATARIRVALQKSEGGRADFNPPSPSEKANLGAMPLMAEGLGKGEDVIHGESLEVKGLDLKASASGQGRMEEENGYEGTLKKKEVPLP
jgi:hypothetical protein